MRTFFFFFCLIIAVFPLFVSQPRRLTWAVIVFKFIEELRWCCTFQAHTDVKSSPLQCLPPLSCCPPFTCDIYFDPLTLFLSQLVFKAPQFNFYLCDFYETVITIVSYPLVRLISKSTKLEVKVLGWMGALKHGLPKFYGAFFVKWNPKVYSHVGEE